MNKKETVTSQVIVSFQYSMLFNQNVLCDAPSDFQRAQLFPFRSVPCI